MELSDRLLSPRNSVITNLPRHHLHLGTNMAVSVLGVGAVAAPFSNNNPKPPSDQNQTQQENKCSITSERLSYLKRLVDDAVKDHRIFTIKGGWQTLRRAFLKRNWIEKFDVHKQQPKGAPVAASSLDDICSNLPTRETWESPTAHVAKCERTIMSRLLQIHDVDFYWNTRKDQHDLHLRLNCHKLINRFSRSLFTSKEGLCLLLQQMYWHNEPGVAQVNFPRCYVLGFPDHYNNFVDDFRLTACTSLLKFVVKKYEVEDKYAIQSPEGTVSYSFYKFALARLNDYIEFCKHLDIDREPTPVQSYQWDQFIKNFNLIVHENRLFLESKEYCLEDMVASSAAILKKLSFFWPQMELDGMKNIWIMKPGNKCRGRGIQLIKDIKAVDKVMEQKLKFVVQKYIERPLIIYQTKFDIRQWFLLTSVQPLIIWMYRDSYLRFSSQNFNLDNFHESLHLTNHAVQCKYKNSQSRSKALPQDNMWDCHTFQSYLKDIGHENKWDTVIFPGMRESIIGSMLACQETMDRRPNTFELYGADFILAEDFKPWLLEINSSPDLSSSTSVTAKMCPQCLEDLVKVVIDKRRDPNCDTGLFNLVYKQNLPRAPAYLGMSLTVRGRKMFKKKSQKRDKENDEKKKDSRTMKLSPPDLSSMRSQELENSEPTRKYSGPIIQDLIQELRKTVYHDSDDEVGFEVAEPVKPVKKKPSKSESRVAKVESMPPIKSNKNNCSPRIRPNVKESYKIPRTAPPKMVKSKENESVWNLSQKTLNFGKTNDLWEKETVSILRGRNKFNKLSKNPTDLNNLRPIAFSSHSYKRRSLLTVGYPVSLKNLKPDF